MCAKRVTDPNPIAGVRHVLKATNPLNRDILLKALEDHPDQILYDRLKEYSDKHDKGYLLDMLETVIIKNMYHHCKYIPQHNPCKIANASNGPNDLANGSDITVIAAEVTVVPYMATWSMLLILARALTE